MNAITIKRYLGAIQISFARKVLSLGEAVAALNEMRKNRGRAQRSPAEGWEYLQSSIRLFILSDMKQLDVYS